MGRSKPAAAWSSVGRSAACVWAVLAFAGPAAAEPVSGAVFLDANANGRRDQGEAGLAGVAVTDGLAFVQTDTQGRYALDARPDPLMPAASRPIVAVSFPAGHWPTTAWFRRAEDAADTAAVDFGLRRDDQTLPVTFVHGTDCHVPRGGKGVFKAFRRDVAALEPRPRFVILTGDLTNGSEKLEPKAAITDFRLFADGAADFPAALFCLPGNHDVTAVNPPRAQDDPGYGYGLYRRFVGPLRWSFDWAGHHLVGLDFNDRETTAAADGSEVEKWVWRTPASAVEWLKADLARIPNDRPILLFVHWPTSAHGLPEALKGRRVAAIFVGHSHGEGPAQTPLGQALMGGSIAPNPPNSPVKPGFRVVTVSADGVKGDYVLFVWRSLIKDLP